MKKLLIKLLISIGAVWLAGFLTNELMGGGTDVILVDNIKVATIVALVLAVLNAFIKPLIKIIAFPLTLLTLGLFLFAINAFIVMICDYLVDGFAVSGFVAALVYSIVLSVITWILNALIR